MALIKEAHKKRAELVAQGLKDCTKCKDIKPLDEFYNNKTRPYGKTDWCDSCTKEHRNTSEFRAHQRKYRIKPEVKAKEKEYYKTTNYKMSQQRYKTSPKGRVVAKRQDKRREDLHPEKRKAKDFVHNMVRAGVLPQINTQKCKHCGNRADHYHHWSYLPEHWIEVIPLCKQCHVNLHQGLEYTASI